MPVLNPSGIIERSAQGFIESALRLVGSLRSGQNLSASELTDSLTVLNDMLDAWNAERLMIYTVARLTQDQDGNTLTLVANQADYTLGNTGGEDLLLPRPPRLERVSIMYSASQQTPVELPMDMYDDVDWQGVANKTTPSLLPQVCYNDKGFPDMTLSFWPVPTQANPIVLYSWQALTLFADLQTKYSFPPAYAKAIRFNLAVDLAAEFPCDLQKLQLVTRTAATSRAVVKSLNTPIKEAWCDSAIVGDGRVTGNIYTGTPTRSHGY